MLSRTCLTVGALVLVVAGCGSGNDDAATADDDKPSTTSTTSTTAAPSTTVAPPTSQAGGGGGGGGAGSTISLDVEVTSPGTPALVATVSCAGSATGTGFLAGPAATAACDHLRTKAAATRRLVEGRPPDLLCTEIYGGPETAHITGTINGAPVDTKITRTDGCGIADWTTLGALLAPAS